MGEAKNMACLSYYSTSIGLIYVVIGLLSGFGLVYIIVTGNKPESMMVSAHSHFICMSTLILIVGFAMKNWSREIEEKKVALSMASLKVHKHSLFS